MTYSNVRLLILALLLSAGYDFIPKLLKVPRFYLLVVHHEVAWVYRLFRVHFGLIFSIGFFNV